MKLYVYRLQSIVRSIVLFGGVGLFFCASAFGFFSQKTPKISSIPLVSGAGGAYINNDKFSAGAFYGRFLMPLLTNHINNVFYSYFNVMQYTNPTSELNIALGYRQLFGHSFMLGGYVMGDYRNTANYGSHSQITMGGELRYHKFFLGANGYVPISESLTHVTHEYTPMDNNKSRLKANTFQDSAFGGFDVTGGVQLTHKLTTYLGLRYFLSAKEINYDMVGPVVRIEYNIWNNQPHTLNVKLIAQYHHNIVEKNSVLLGMRFILQSHAKLQGMAKYFTAFPLRDIDIVHSEHGKKSMFDKVVYTVKNDSEMRKALADPTVDIINVNGFLQSIDMPYVFNRDVSITSKQYTYTYNGKTYTYNFLTADGVIHGGTNTVLFSLDGTHNIDFQNLTMVTDVNTQLFTYDANQDLGWLRFLHNTIKNADMHFVANRHLRLSLENNEFRNSYLHILYDSNTAHIEIPQFHDNTFIFDGTNPVYVDPAFQVIQTGYLLSHMWIYIGRSQKSEYSDITPHTFADQYLNSQVQINIGDIKNNKFLIKDVPTLSMDDPYIFSTVFMINTLGGHATIGDITHNEINSYNQGIGAPSNFGMIFWLAGNAVVGNIENNTIYLHIPHWSHLSRESGQGMFVGYGNNEYGDIKYNHIRLTVSENLYPTTRISILGIQIQSQAAFKDEYLQKYFPINRNGIVGDIAYNTIENIAPDNTIGSWLLYIMAVDGSSLTINNIQHNTLKGVNTSGVLFASRHFTTGNLGTNSLVVQGEFSDNTFDLTHKGTVNLKYNGIYLFTYNANDIRNSHTEAPNTIVFKKGFHNNQFSLKGRYWKGLYFNTNDGLVHVMNGMNNNTITISPVDENDPTSAVDSYAIYVANSNQYKPGYVFIDGFKNNTLSAYYNPIYIKLTKTGSEVRFDHFQNNIFTSLQGNESLDITLSTGTKALFSFDPWLLGTNTASLLANNNHGATYAFSGAGQLVSYK